MGARSWDEGGEASDAKSAGLPICTAGGCPDGVRHTDVPHEVEGVEDDVSRPVMEAMRRQRLTTGPKLANPRAELRRETPCSGVPADTGTARWMSCTLLATPRGSGRPGRLVPEMPGLEHGVGSCQPKLPDESSALPPALRAPDPRDSRRPSFALTSIWQAEHGSCHHGSCHHSIGADGVG